jgi:hypothetical protein
MKSKLVLWGTTEQNDRVLIAMELRAEDNKVHTWLFPEAIASPDFSQKMLNDWRNGATVDFPEGATHTERDLSLTDNLLPEGLTVDRPDFVQRAQTEWQFIVLSTKLNQAYKSEIAEFGDKIEQLAYFSIDAFNGLRNFWGKVNAQVKERNLFREHADDLRNTTNSLFEKLKAMKTEGGDFEENSKKWFDQLSTKLDEIEKIIEAGLQRFPDVFEKLKNAQKEFKEQKLTRDHSNELWNRIDVLFKSLKDKRFGNEAIHEGTASDRLEKRLEGLISAVDKMQSSIDRDREELNFQQKRVASSEGQLEAQIRQAKINMILERVKSKDEKLADMIATKQDVESKITSFRAKDERRAAEDAKKAADIAKKAEAPAPAAVVVEETQPLAQAVAEPLVVEMPKEPVVTRTVIVGKIVEPTAPTVSEAKTEVKGDNEMAEIAAAANAALEAVDAVS